MKSTLNAKPYNITRSMSNDTASRRIYGSDNQQGLPMKSMFNHEEEKSPQPKLQKHPFIQSCTPFSSQQEHQASQASCDQSSSNG
jgi:hypothetical protein